MHPKWVRDIRDQCSRGGVAFHFKQWGAWAPHNLGPGGDLEGSYTPRPKGYGFFDYNGRWNPSDGGNPFRQSMVNVGKRRSGADLDGREWREFPEVSS